MPSNLITREFVHSVSSVSGNDCKSSTHKKPNNNRRQRIWKQVRLVRRTSDPLSAILSPFRSHSEHMRARARTSTSSTAVVRVTRACTCNRSAHAMRTVNVTPCCARAYAGSLSEFRLTLRCTNQHAPIADRFGNKWIRTPRTCAHTHTHVYMHVYTITYVKNRSTNPTRICLYLYTVSYTSHSTCKIIISRTKLLQFFGCTY